MYVPLLLNLDVVGPVPTTTIVFSFGFEIQMYLNVEYGVIGRRQEGVVRAINRTGKISRFNRQAVVSDF